ncbi:hypothetical protein [Paenibacillus sp. WC2504]|uniref:hypothetical protein n=1 Tax=Paenibacillus sp. WC2504 TaxID=3461403 RepID=UPI004045B0E9
MDNVDKIVENSRKPLGGADFALLFFVDNAVYAENRRFEPHFKFSEQSSSGYFRLWMKMLNAKTAGECPWNLEKWSELWVS